MKFFDEFRKSLSSAEYLMKSNFDECATVPINMFDYDNIHEDLQQYFEDFEKILIMDGIVAIGKLNGKFVFVRGGLGGGELNEYGYPTRFIGATGNGIAVDWKIGVDCVVIFNNKKHTPDFGVLKTADILTDIDISIDDNIYYSRFYPIPLARDEREKNQISDIFANLRKGGKKTTVLNKKTDVADIVNGTNQDISVLNITDVENADKIQYLSRIREDVKRWFLNNNGHDLQGSSKMAQQSVDEINGANSVSMIYPLEKLEMRIKGIDEFNALFGQNMTVSFSPAWLIEYEKFVKDSIGSDELPDDPTEELPDDANPEDEPENAPEGTTEDAPEGTNEDAPEDDEKGGDGPENDENEEDDENEDSK